MKQESPGFNHGECQKGFDGDIICALSDDDNCTTYYLDGLNGIEFAESFTSEGDILNVYDDFL